MGFYSGGLLLVEMLLNQAHHQVLEGDIFF